MWIRLQFDIGWRDLCYGWLAALFARNRAAAQQRLEREWSRGNDDALACLSVRSALDLLFQALNLPAGSEVLYSAVTIPDMVEVARRHNLVPVPIDVQGADYHVDVDSLRRAITAKSKVLVVAHLFGARPDIAAVRELAREQNLFLVEDCAQAWCGKDWRGDELADASLFSFGGIKTAAALGGALARVRDAAILRKMRELQSDYPVEPQWPFALRILKFALLKGFSSRPVFALLLALGRLFGKGVDDVLGGLTRGFPEGDLLALLRRRPCAALLVLLRHRIATYDERRIERRVANARRIIRQLELTGAQPELADARHTFWLFPYQTETPLELALLLRQHGFDSTQRGRLEVVPAPPNRPELECPSAKRLLEQTLFLPCYPAMPAKAIDRLCNVVAARGES